MMKIPTFIRGAIAAVLVTVGGGGVNTAFATCVDGGGTGAIACAPSTHVADADGDGAIAIGALAGAQGNQGVAIGQGADAAAPESIAIGQQITITQAATRSIAIGNRATTRGTHGIAIGSNRGTTSVTAAANQIAIGDAMHTQVDIGGVRLKGDGGGQQSVVTRLAGLETMLGMPTATDPAPTGGVAFRTDIDSLRREFGEDVEMLSGGVAIGLALDAPYLRPGRQFAVRLGSGYFNGEAAIGLSATARYEESDKIFLDASIGAAAGEVGGGIGVTWQF